MENQKKKTNDILKQGTILAAASILVRLIGMVYRIPLGNQLGEVGNGYYSIAYSIYSLALIISSYGLPLAVSKMVADKNTKKEYKNSYKIFKNSLLFSIIVGALVGGIIFFGADFFAGLMKSPGSVKPLKVLAPTIFCVAMLGVFRGFFKLLDLLALENLESRILSSKCTSLRVMPIASCKTAKENAK